MIRKAWLLLIPAALGLLIASQWPDIRRYLKIEQLSRGQGHPENVPVGEPARIRTPAVGNGKAQGIRLVEEARSTAA
jgi:hypothetical protein